MMIEIYAIYYFLIHRVSQKANTYIMEDAVNL